jgi:mono/diheme cytochrome c family protein/plastocyanin
MAARPVGHEAAARLAVGAAALALPLALFGAWRISNDSGPVTLHARMSEEGGWTPDTLRVEVGQPLALRLVSDDVVHGFAVGHSEAASLELLPGQFVSTTLTFDEPGTYTFYCTRWCGPDHWRMRGVIEVSDPAGAAVPPSQPPLYETLGIDLDAPHPAAVVPNTRPSAARGAARDIALPEALTARSSYVARAPAETWLELRADPSTGALSDDEVWDLVAWAWRANTTEATLEQGASLFAQNCAACHGETGAGDGVMSDSVTAATMEPNASTPGGPADFTDPSRMLGASPALLHGKITRGGMGTGMPYWGPLFTEAGIWALTDYLWTFQFEETP